MGNCLISWFVTSNEFSLENHSLWFHVLSGFRLHRFSSPLTKFFALLFLLKCCCFYIFLIRLASFLLVALRSSDLVMLFSVETISCDFKCFCCWMRRHNRVVRVAICSQIADDTLSSRRLRSQLTLNPPSVLRPHHHASKTKKHGQNRMPSRRASFFVQEVTSKALT